MIKYERTVKSMEDIQSDLDILTDIIPKTVPTEKIILFGSFTRGEQHEDSDIDVYVVLKDEINMRPLDAMDEMRYALGRKISMPMDLAAGLKSRFDERKVLPTLERVINTEGIVLYGN